MPATNPRQTYYTTKSLLRARWLLERMTVDDAFAALEVKSDVSHRLFRAPHAVLLAARDSSRVVFRDELELQKDARSCRWLAPSQGMLGRNAPLPG